MQHPKLPFDGDYDFGQAWLAVREWRDPSTAPYMRRKAVEYFAPRVALWMSAFFLVAHWYWAIITHSSTNFARAGAVIVFIAAALYAVLEWHDPKSAMPSGRQIQKIKFFNPGFLLPFLVAAGTLIWGYGDLLPFFANKMP